jgi:hypothetical protein
MAGSRGWRGGGRQGGAVQAMFENRLDALIGTGAEGQGPAAGRFQPLAAVAFPQPHDA